MRVLFDKLNLIDSLIMESALRPEEFIEKLELIVDNEPHILLDELYRTKKLYCGKVEKGNFTLRKKRKFLNPNIQASNAKGVLNFKNQKTEVQMEIFGYDELSATALIILPFFLLFIFSIVIINEAYPALILFIPLALLMLYVPYSIMKSDMKRFKIELEKNLSFT